MSRGNALIERLLHALAAVVRRIPVERGKLFVMWKTIPPQRIARKGYLKNYVFAARDGILWDASTWPDSMTVQMVWSGSYQDDVLLCFDLFLRESQVVFDIGAHFGLMSIVAGKRVGRTGRVIAFEPNPHTRQVLQRHLALNNMTNVAIEPIGLIDREGSLDFYMTEVSWNATFVKGFVDYHQHEYEKTTVTAETLDGYIARTGLKPDFIKLDVEGAEYECLLGARETLRAHKPVIVTEFNRLSQASGQGDENRLLRLLQECGYQMFVPRRSVWGHYRAQDIVPLDLSNRAANGDLFNVLCLPDRAVEEQRMPFGRKLAAVSAPR